jgi:ATP-dependent Lhr-like helicase
LPHVFERLHESLQEVLVHRLGWDDLREVQEMTYLAVSGGKDVLVIAPTAGGKTEAALIPVTDGILSAGLSGVACIYLSPLKASSTTRKTGSMLFPSPADWKWQNGMGTFPRGTVRGPGVSPPTSC